MNRNVDPPSQQTAASVGKPRAALRFVWTHRWFALAVLAALSIGAWQAGRVLLGPAVVVDRVGRGVLVQTVVASGHVETPFRVEIGAQVTGVVAEVLVQEGQTVREGQRLIELRPEELRANLVQAEGAVAQAEARLRQLAELTLPMAREALIQTRVTLRTAQAAYDRTAELFRNGNATRVAYDEAQRALDVARTQVRTAELQEFTASPGGSDEVLARTQLAQAHATLDTARARLSYATIVSPRDGLLISRNVERGAVVQPGKTLLVLAPAGETQLVMQIDERNLGLIEIGQKAVASADAFPNRRFEAYVSFVNPAVDIARASVEVKLTVPDPPAYLRQDMTVSVDVEFARRDDALVLPARAVRDMQSGRAWILVLRDGRAVRRPVRVGIRGQSQVEILEGAGEGDLAVPVNAGVVTGQRLRPVVP
ncbi:MAG: efflux RND transporter periplasmic adaptor subunit [Bosea sp.]|jgi:HlyD family secretion protein|nr:efflux RND transporter periplasmic adaptor subunit [Bosea sp. (in: a-proteobacteria)]